MSADGKEPSNRTGDDSEGAAPKRGGNHEEIQSFGDHDEGMEAV